MPAFDPKRSDAGRRELAAQKRRAATPAPVQQKPAGPRLAIPPILSAPVQASQQQSRPRPRPQRKAPPKRGMDRLWNDIRYELGPKGGTGKTLRRAGREISRDAAQGKLLTPMGLLNPSGYVGRNVATGALGAVDNAARLGYSAWQRYVERKPKADPTAGWFGGALEAVTEGGYRILGSKPPSEMSQAELDRDQLRRSLAGDAIAAVATRGRSLAAMRATTVAGKTFKGGTAFAAAELLSNVFSDNTGGNASNLVNAGLSAAGIGARLPFSIDVGKDDPVDSFWKSLIPNTAAGMVAGEAIGAGVGLAGKSLRAMGVPLKHTKQQFRERWGGRAEAAERAEQLADDLLRQDAESGAYALNVPDPKAPKPGEPPQKTWSEPPMPDQAEPDFDPWFSEFDPALPTSTNLGRAIGDLSDQELSAAFSGGGPVVPRIEEVLQARGQRAPMPPTPAQILPAEVLPDDYLAELPNKWRGMADGDKPFDLEPLFDPEVNPEIWKRAQGMTGAETPADLTPTDMADVLDAMLEDGRAVIPSRMGAEMMPVAGIRRPVPAPGATQVDATANPWDSPVAGPDLPDQARWDPRQEGAITVAQDPLGATVVDGNKRLGLAQRLGVEQVPVTRASADGPAPKPEAPVEAPPRIELDPEERARMKRELLRQAAEGGEIRPPDAPIPAFSDAPLRRLDEVDMDKPVEPGSPEAQALADEARLAADALRNRAALDRAATEAARASEGYELKTFEQKKAEGLVDGFRRPEAGPAEPAPPATAVAPERPAPVRLSDSGGPQPGFTLPQGMPKGVTRYGSKQVRFASDLDQAAYVMLAKGDGKMIKDAQAQVRSALDAAGIPVGQVINHGLEVKQALRRSKASGDGVIDLPAQPWGGAAKGIATASATRMSQANAFSPEDVQLWNETNQSTLVLLKQLMPQIREEIRHVLGPDADLKIHNAFRTERTPMAWGGGEEYSAISGLYTWFDDTVQVWTRTDPALLGLPEGAMPGSLTPREIIRTGIHEAVHRIVRRSLSDSELRILNSEKARSAVRRLAPAIYSNAEILDMAYDELLTEVVTEYVVLRRAGRDAWKELLDKASRNSQATGSNVVTNGQDQVPLAGLLGQVPLLQKAVEKVYAFIEKSRQFFQERASLPVRDIFEAIQQGLARNSVEDLRPQQITPNPDDPENPLITFHTDALGARMDKTTYWQVTNVNRRLLDSFIALADEQGARGDWSVSKLWADLSEKVQLGLFDRDIVSINRIKAKVDAQQSALMKKLQDLEDRATKGGCL